MRPTQMKLYSVTAPLALLPLMNVSVNEIGDFVRRYLEQQMANLPNLFASLLISLIEAMVHPLIDTVVRVLFGVV